MIFFIKQYNTLQKLTVEIKEARANIIVAYEKKVAIINQYLMNMAIMRNPFN